MKMKLTSQCYKLSAYWKLYIFALNSCLYKFLCTMNTSFKTYYINWHWSIKLAWGHAKIKKNSAPWRSISVDWSAVGLIPGQGTYLGCRFNPWSGSMWEATNWWLFLSHIDVCLSVCLSPPSSLSLKSINISSGEN